MADNNEIVELESRNVQRTYQYDNCSWSTASIVDELIYQLSSACSFTIDENKQIHISHKYYDRAEFILYRINIYKPSPEFVISRSDLTDRLQGELEQLYISSPKTFNKIVTKAVQVILEGVNQRYYHVNRIAYKVRWRFLP